MTTKWCYRNEYVHCGKRNCKACPHGPYWYRYQRRGAKVHKEYVGKIKPDDLAGELHREHGRVWDKFDEILAPGGLLIKNAWAVLDLPPMATEGEAKRAFRKASMLHHPDRRGDKRRMQAVNIAYDYLRHYHGWK
jgi:DnaJ domain